MSTDTSIATRVRCQTPISRATALCVLGALLVTPIRSLAAPKEAEPEHGALAVGQSGNNERFVFEVRIAQAGLRCPTGGQVLLGGIDQNLNRALDPIEVEETVIFCNGIGPSGETSGFHSRQESASIVCPKGGTRYAWGYDDDGNGRLDDDEELFFVRVCHAKR